MIERSEIDINEPIIKHLLEFDTLKLYLEEGLDPDFSSGFFNLLFSTINFPDKMKLVLDAGAFVNFQDNYGTTPLHFACMVDCLECISLLFEAGANPLINDYNSKTPLDFCCSDSARNLIKDKINQMQAERILRVINEETPIDGKETKKRKM